MYDTFKPQIELLSRRGRRLRMREEHARLSPAGIPYPAVVNDIAIGVTNAIDTSRAPSWFWNRIGFESIRSRGGVAFYDDFTMAGNANMSSALAGSIGQWSMYGDAGAQLNDAGIEGGGVTLSNASDNKGLALLSSAGSCRFITTSTLAYNRKMVFEARVARSTITTTKGEFFVGLMKPTLSSGLPATAQPITTTDDTLMTAGDFFGFHCCSSSGTRGGPTEVAVAFELASGTINYPTNLTTLMASTGNTVLAGGTYVKLGWIFDPFSAPYRLVTLPTGRQTTGTRRRAIIRFFVNGVEAPTFLTSDDVANATSGQAFPTAFMAPVIAHMNTTGSTPATTSIDWIKVAQEANS